MFSDSLLLTVDGYEKNEQHTYHYKLINLPLVFCITFNHKRNKSIHQLQVSLYIGISAIQVNSLIRY